MQMVTLGSIGCRTASSQVIAARVRPDLTGQVRISRHGFTTPQQSAPWTKTLPSPSRFDPQCRYSARSSWVDGHTIGRRLERGLNVRVSR